LLLIDLLSTDNVVDFHAMISTLRSQAAVARKFALWFLILSLVALGLACRPRPQPEKAAEATPTPPVAVPINPLAAPSPIYGKPYPGTGVVTIINLKEGWVEIKHEEIKGLMPAMTMEFWARNRALLKRVQVGDKVDFVVVEDRKGQFITKLDRAAPDR
jgi:Cu/Ag efflux protein CusF